MTQATTKKEVKPSEATVVSEENIKLKGKYIYAVGKRKTSAAQVRLYKNGSGVIMINSQKGSSYLGSDLIYAVQPLKLCGHQKDLNFSIVVSGGGKRAQSIACRHGISRALVEMDEELRASLRAKEYLTRDARVKERKKPGLKKARRAPQWAKR